MTITQIPSGVHFVGSIPCEASEDAWSAVFPLLSGIVKRISDGEPKHRKNFTQWQVPTFMIAPRLMKTVFTQLDPEREPSIAFSKISKLLENYQSGYDQVAIESYAKFVEQRKAGTIPSGVKFQVCIPTPINIWMNKIQRHYQEAVEPIHVAAIVRAVRNIQTAIPHEDLAIQWDCALDFGVLELMLTNPDAIQAKYRNMGDVFDFHPWFATFDDAGSLDGDALRLGVLQRMARMAMSDIVNEDVEVGYHLCYGDLAHAHFVEPKDTATIAMVIKYLLKHVDRKINWIHFPVPKGRSDEAYLEPIAEVLSAVTQTDTKLYLGLVHAEDEQGTKERIESAKRVLGDNVAWGVGTECGMGRTPAEQLSSILHISKSVAGLEKVPSKPTG